MQNFPPMQGKNILITGGSGFLGRALIRALKSEQGSIPASIRVLARDEGKLLAIQREFDVEIIPGDVTDFGDVLRAMRGANYVFHLSGFKHLPLAEKESQKAIETNVVGSLNVLEASALMKSELVLGVSTDKAYNPMNCYGMTKRLMEYMFAEYEAKNADTKYRIVRYGNVLGSTGSVIEIWRDAVARGEPLRVTDREMTRFFFGVDDAVQTIFNCLATSTDATPYVPTMKAARMGDLVEVVAEMLNVKYGYRPSIEIVGLRPGEKLHEGMADDAQSDIAEKYTQQEILRMLQDIV